MKIKSPIITTAQGVKTQKPFRPSTVRLVLEVKTNWSARIDGIVQIAVDLPLDLARQASRLLRRAATRAEQRLAAALEKERARQAAVAARARPEKPAPGSARQRRGKILRPSSSTPQSQSPAIAARKRPAARHSSLRKSAGIAAEIRAGRKL